MKKIIYITLFTIFGVQLSFIFHFILEIGIINLLISDFDVWGLGLSWASWFLIHRIVTIVLLLLGVWFGFTQGKYWWKALYVEKRFRVAQNDT